MDNRFNVKDIVLVVLVLAVGGLVLLSMTQKQRQWEVLQDALSEMKDQRESVDLYHFTKVITDKLDMDGRLQLIEYLWETAYADGVLDEYESNLIWRVAELIGVETRDRVRLRQQVQAKLGIDNETKPI